MVCGGVSIVVLGHSGGCTRHCSCNQEKQQATGVRILYRTVAATDGWPYQVIPLTAAASLVACMHACMHAWILNTTVWCTAASPRNIHCNKVLTCGPQHELLSLEGCYCEL
jgi:hypothetical protein